MVLFYDAPERRLNVLKSEWLLCLHEQTYSVEDRLQIKFAILIAARVYSSLSTRW